MAYKYVLLTFLSLSGAHVFIAGFSFLTTIMLASNLGAETFGRYSYGVAFGGYVLTLALVGMSQTQVRDLVQQPEKRSEYVTGGILLSVLMLAVSFIALIVFNFFVASAKQLTTELLVIAMVMGLKAVDLRPAFDAADRMRIHTLTLVVERSIFLGGLWAVFAFMRQDLGLTAIAVLLVVSTLAGLLSQFWLIRKSIRIELRIGAVHRAVKILHRNLWVWGAMLATLSFGGLSKIVLQMTSGDAELGGYSVAWQIVTLGSLVIARVTQIGNPMLANAVLNPSLGLSKFLWKYVGASLGVATLVATPAIIFPEFILGLLREEYVAFSSTMRVLGFYVVAIGIFQVLTQYLVAVKRESVYMAVILVTGLTSPVLFQILIPRYESLGAALAVLLTHGLGVAVLGFYVARHIKKSSSVAI